MSEDVEFDPKDTREALDRVEEGLEREIERTRAPRWIAWVALTTAIFSVIAAISALEAASYSNQSLTESNRAVLYQAQASDQWAYYQAKGIKSNVRQAGADLLAVSHAPEQQVTAYRTEAKRAQTEQAEISKKATELEKQSQEARLVADRFEKVHQRFAYAVTLLQVAIALASVAALTRQRPVWVAGLVAGVGGLGFFGSGFVP